LQLFNEKSQEFRTSRISAPAFALSIKALIAASCHPEARRAEGSPDLDSSPCGLRMTEELLRLVGNQKHLHDIEGTKFFRDFEHYAADVKQSLLRSDAEKELDREGRKLELLGKLIHLELSREEWKELKSKIASSAYGLLAMTDASEMSLRAQRTINGRSNLAFSPDSFNSHIAFYETAVKRDEAMFKNLLSAMEKGDKASLLVAGGFHTQGFTARLKEKNISYVLLMPQIKSIPDQTHYREHMRGDVSWKKYFEIENGRINFYKAFVRATRDKLLKSANDSNDPSRNQLIKEWRDQIIRDLAKQEKITGVGRYISFLDETVKGTNDKTLAENFRKIDKFVAKMRGLETKGELTAPNLLKLLQPATQADLGGEINLSPQNSVSIGSIELLSQSELRNLKWPSPADIAHFDAEIDEPIGSQVVRAKSSPIELKIEGDRLQVVRGGKALTSFFPQAPVADVIADIQAKLNGRTIADWDIPEEGELGGQLVLTRDDRWRVVVYFNRNEVGLLPPLASSSELRATVEEFGFNRYKNAKITLAEFRHLINLVNESLNRLVKDPVIQKLYKQRSEDEQNEKIERFAAEIQHDFRPFAAIGENGQTQVEALVAAYETFLAQSEIRPPFYIATKFENGLPQIQIGGPEAQWISLKDYDVLGDALYPHNVGTRREGQTFFLERTAAHSVEYVTGSNGLTYNPEQIEGALIDLLPFGTPVYVFRDREGEIMVELDEQTFNWRRSNFGLESPLSDKLQKFGITVVKDEQKMTIDLIDIKRFNFSVDDFPAANEPLTHRAFLDRIARGFRDVLPRFSEMRRPTGVPFVLSQGENYILFDEDQPFDPNTRIVLKYVQHVPENEGEVPSINLLIKHSSSLEVESPRNTPTEDGTLVFLAPGEQARIYHKINPDQSITFASVELDKIFGRGAARFNIKAAYYHEQSGVRYEINKLDVAIRKLLEELWESKGVPGDLETKLREAHTVLKRGKSEKEYRKAREILEGVSTQESNSRFREEILDVISLIDEFTPPVPVSAPAASGSEMRHIELQAPNGSDLQLIDEAGNVLTTYAPSMPPSAVVNEVQAKANGPIISWKLGPETDGQLELIRQDGWRIVVYHDKHAVDLLAPRSEMRFHHSAFSSLVEANQYHLAGELGANIEGALGLVREGVRLLEARELVEQALAPALWKEVKSGDKEVESVDKTMAQRALRLALDKLPRRAGSAAENYSVLPKTFDRNTEDSQRLHIETRINPENQAAEIQIGHPRAPWTRLDDRRKMTETLRQYKIHSQDTITQGRNGIFQWEHYVGHEINPLSWEGQGIVYDPDQAKAMLTDLLPWHVNVNAFRDIQSGAIKVSVNGRIFDWAANIKRVDSELFKMLSGFGVTATRDRNMFPIRLISRRPFQYEVKESPTGGQRVSPDLRAIEAGFRNMLGRRSELRLGIRSWQDFLKIATLIAASFLGTSPAPLLSQDKQVQAEKTAAAEKDEKVKIGEAFVSDKLSYNYFNRIQRATKRGLTNPINDSAWLPNTIKDGILSFDEARTGWAGEGVNQARLPGKSAGYKYVYLKVYVPDEDEAAFKLELKGFFEGKREFKRKGKGWHTLEIEITGDKNLSYFAISDMNKPLKFADLELSKEKRPAVNVKSEMRAGGTDTIAVIEGKSELTQADVLTFIREGMLLRRQAEDSVSMRASDPRIIKIVDFESSPNDMFLWTVDSFRGEGLVLRIITLRNITSGNIDQISVEAIPGGLEPVEQVPAGFTLKMDASSSAQIREISEAIRDRRIGSQSEMRLEPTITYGAAVEAMREIYPKYDGVITVEADLRAAGKGSAEDLLLESYQYRIGIWLTQEEQEQIERELARTRELNLRPEDERSELSLIERGGRLTRVQEAIQDLRAMGMQISAISEQHPVHQIHSPMTHRDAGHPYIDIVLPVTLRSAPKGNIDHLFDAVRIYARAFLEGNITPNENRILLRSLAAINKIKDEQIKNERDRAIVNEFRGTKFWQPELTYIKMIGAVRPGIFAKLDPWLRVNWDEAQPIKRGAFSMDEIVRIFPPVFTLALGERMGIEFLRQGLFRLKTKLELIVRFLESRSEMRVDIQQLLLDKKWEVADREAEALLRPENLHIYRSLLLTGTPKPVSAFLIDHLAQPDVAEKLDAADLDSLLVAAENNSDGSINGRATAIRRMIEGIGAGTFFAKETFALPTRSTQLKDFHEAIERVDAISELEWKRLSRGKQIDSIDMKGKPPRTTVLEQHFKTDQTFWIEEGVAYFLVAAELGEPLQAIRVEAGQGIRIG
ncbi:MAG: hypothetical protein HYZ84_04465, partial [Candidatus Omnitrophica bacterium]|nr:hypothetical protein [Candidatus Omnitrophota bacterium]